jgi:2,3-diaminopropionate biosynthesis protein SbnA
MYQLNPIIESAIGNTPMIPLSTNIYAKMEGSNLFGSAKDRAANYILADLLKRQKIDKSTKIIESSSGNFAIALAGVCRVLGMTFICVIDPLLNPANKSILECLNANFILVTKPDENNSYSKSRINMIQDIINQNKNIYWINQYDNPIIPSAYYSLGQEIVCQVPNVRYIFVPVSTCGTIAGISHIVKKYNSSIKIIAVDLDCSNIFYPAITKQHIPGMGLFRKPENLNQAKIDDVVIVSELESIKECHCLLDKGIFVGVSSGATLCAIKKYSHKISPHEIVVAVFPDRGERYIKTAYNNDWCKKYFPQYITSSQNNVKNYELSINKG